jgi:hypothetical protein
MARDLNIHIFMVSRIFITLLMLFSVTLVGSFASAKVNVRKTKRLTLPEKTEAKSLTDLLTVDILPASLAENATSDSLLAKVADNSLALYWRNSPLRYSATGKAIETAEKKLNVQATYRDQNHVDHKFNFKVLALQALAKIQYTGWVNAALNYDLKAARAAAEVIEPLSDKKDLVLSHEVGSGEQKSAVSLKWKW